MQGMIDGGFRPIVRAYALSIAVDCNATIVLPALGSDSKGSADPPLLVETIEGNHARVDRGR
jgi:hypothetical protein